MTSYASTAIRSGASLMLIVSLSCGKKEKELPLPAIIKSPTPAPPFPQIAEKSIISSEQNFPAIEHKENHAVTYGLDDNSIQKSMANDLARNIVANNLGLWLANTENAPFEKRLYLGEQYMNNFKQYKKLGTYLDKAWEDILRVNAEVGAADTVNYEEFKQKPTTEWLVLKCMDNLKAFKKECSTIQKSKTK